MTGVTRGARLWLVYAGEVCAGTILDRGPDGWWVAIEGKTDERGHSRMEQIPARKLYPSKSAATGILMASR